MSTFWVVLSGTLTGAVGPGVSVLCAVYGELITERAGRINLGMEGCMLMGACFGFIATVETGSATAGVLAGMAAGGGLAAVHGYMVVYRDTNQLATGLALTLFGGGITAYAGRGYVDSIINGLNPIAVPLLADIPVIGDALFRQDILEIQNWRRHLRGITPVVGAFIARRHGGRIEVGIQTLDDAAEHSRLAGVEAQHLSEPTADVNDDSTTAADALDAGMGYLIQRR